MSEHHSRLSHCPSRSNIFGVVDVGLVHFRLMGVLQRDDGERDEAVELLPVSRFQKPLMEPDLHQLLELTLLLPSEKNEETKKLTTK